jgi:hypothetical protein
LERQGCCRILARSPSAKGRWTGGSGCAVALQGMNARPRPSTFPSVGSRSGLDPGPGPAPALPDGHGRRAPPLGPASMVLTWCQTLKARGRGPVALAAAHGNSAGIVLAAAGGPATARGAIVESATGPAGARIAGNGGRVGACVRAPLVRVQRAPVLGDAAEPGPPAIIETDLGRTFALETRIHVGPTGERGASDDAIRAAAVAVCSIGGGRRVARRGWLLRDSPTRPWRSKAWPRSPCN